MRLFPSALSPCIDQLGRFLQFEPEPACTLYLSETPLRVTLQPHAVQDTLLSGRPLQSRSCLSHSFLLTKAFVHTCSLQLEVALVTTLLIANWLALISKTAWRFAFLEKWNWDNWILLVLFFLSAIFSNVYWRDIRVLYKYRTRSDVRSALKQFSDGISDLRASHLFSSK